MNNPTICALATARGSGGIAIVRISGADAESLLRRAFVPAHTGRAFESHRMMYGRVTDETGATIDEAMAVLMRAPNSYTREDVAEVQCHGGDVAARRVLARLIALGARPAEPGEFTKRAFLNGRIDLSRAEAVMQLIGAGSEAAARASVRQLEGGVSGFVKTVSAEIVRVLATVEAATDFPDEIEEETAAHEVIDALEPLIREIERRCDPKGLKLLREGASIVLAGRPNVGKSSLMNALLRENRAIVTSIPGTTRDVLTERISLGGVTAQLSDTAGQRDTLDPVERIGVDRARTATERADIVLMVLDASEALTEEDIALLRSADERAIVCLNKNDLAGQTSEEDIRTYTDAPLMTLSAGTGEGVEALVGALTERVTAEVHTDCLTVERHIRLASRSAEHLRRAVRTLGEGMPLDVICVDLDEALRALAEITQSDPTEEVITEIFSKFCVGK